MIRLVRQCALGAALLLSALTAQAAPGIDHIYAFGDSYSDNGALLALTRQMAPLHIPGAVLLPADPKTGIYWQGRWSNGPTAIEDLAASLHVGLTDYAIGGAKTGEGNFYAWIDYYRDTGVLGQARLFEEGLGGKKADPRALYFIAASANDLFQALAYSRAETPEILADRAVANTRQAVEELIGLGAKRFLVSEAYSVDGVPFIRTDPKSADAARRFRHRYDAGLLKALQPFTKRSGVSIRFFEWGNETEQIAAHAADYGIANTAAACQVTIPAPKKACANPDAYLFWDEFHPSRRTHQLLAEAMGKVVGD